MRLAVEGVLHACEYARIDGNAIPKGLSCRAEALIGGDASDRAIMAASILAKVTRDRHMVELHRQWPQYGFDEHKGYSTPQHLAALRTHGPCPQHRRSFAPVREALQGTLLPDADASRRDESHCVAADEPHRLPVHPVRRVHASDSRCRRWACGARRARKVVALDSRSAGP
jgi:hypothetical protein